MDCKGSVLLRRAGRMTDPTSVEEYQELGGFQALSKAAATDPEEVLTELAEALVRGRGGAAYPIDKKWRHLKENPGVDKYIVCNADEGEPGTFKDKVLLEQDPLSIIEGMLIAGYVCGASEGYIYLRGEYFNLHHVIQRGIDHAGQAGYLGKNILGIPGFDFRITMISGAGAYVCGENSALLNSIEKKTGRPRVKPPHLADVGLYSQPTLVNNVESFACVPAVLTMGGKAFRALGTEHGGGTKLVCLSGHVKNRGVFEVRLGTPLQELLYAEEYGGGISTGKALGFCHFGGQSGPIGFCEQLDGRLYDYGDFGEHQLSIGSGAIVVMDETVNIIEYLENVMNFFVHESCGKCTPCRLGTTRMLELLQKFRQKKGRCGDLERFEKLLKHVTNLSACGLGQSASVSITSALKYRRTEFERCILEM